MKSQSPLAGEKCLRVRCFSSNPGMWRAAEGQMTGGARQLSERSLKIEYLREAGFRATALLRARPQILAYYASAFSAYRVSALLRYSERGHEDGGL
jgi:hypothetical protein